MKIFLLAASLRQDSFNKKLINICADHLKEKHDTDLGEMKDFDLPLYDGDVEAKGIPANATQFADRMAEADKIIFSVPEYNYSIPGIFKNLIDWVSRIRPMPWKGKKILLISASPAMVGGNRGYFQTRVPLDGCGAFVYPGTFSLASAHEMFDDKAKLKDSKLTKNLHRLLDEFTGS